MNCKEEEIYKGQQVQRLLLRNLRNKKQWWIAKTMMEYSKSKRICVLFWPLFGHCFFYEICCWAVWFAYVSNAIKGEKNPNGGVSKRICLWWMNRRRTDQGNNPSIFCMAEDARWDTAKFCKSCEKCQLKAWILVMGEFLLHIFRERWFAFEWITMSVIGPTDPIPAAGHVYSPHIIDLYTRWAKAVSDALMDFFLSTSGHSQW